VDGLFGGLTRAGRSAEGSTGLESGSTLCEWVLRIPEAILTLVGRFHPELESGSTFHGRVLRSLDVARTLVGRFHAGLYVGGHPPRKGSSEL
jgi:hypothetical protein